MNFPKSSSESVGENEMKMIKFPENLQVWFRINNDE